MPGPTLAAHLAAAAQLSTHVEAVEIRVGDDRFFVRLVSLDRLDPSEEMIDGTVVASEAVLRVQLVPVPS